MPEFAQPRVYVKGSALNPLTEPATEPIRVWHLLTHTSGLTYGFHHAHPVDAMYRAPGSNGTRRQDSIRRVRRAMGAAATGFQPGSEWNYSALLDVLGRLVEVVSGQPLDEFFKQRIFAPLGMNDTSFGTEAEDLAALYVPQPGTRRRSETTRSARSAAAARTACRGAAAWCPRPRTTTGSPNYFCAEASWTG